MGKKFRMQRISQGDDLVLSEPWDHRVVNGEFTSLASTKVSLLLDYRAGDRDEGRLGTVTVRYRT